MAQKHGCLALSIKISKKIQPKMKSLQVLKGSLLQAKSWSFPYKKKVKMILFYLLRQNINIELHVI